jgi:energy-coupling factor transporter transmembrane protein EcfT
MDYFLLGYKIRGEENFFLMLIWLNLLIPVIAIIILMVFFEKKIAWWEYLLVFGVAVLAIFICKYTSTVLQTNTKEWWNSYVTQAQYYEPWDEWIVQTCYRTVSCGKNCTTMVPYDCSHREYHPAEWILVDNLGKDYSISQDFYQFLLKTWGNQKFTDLHRSFYTINGNEYSTNYDNDFDHLAPVCTQHTYTNKVRSSRSIFNFQAVKKDEIDQYGLFSYPHCDMFHYNPILGWNNSQNSDMLQKWNGLLGVRKRVHMLILVFQNQPREAGLMQEAYWKGGNKNEFILCIGVNRTNHITWTKVISWTDVQVLKTSLARKIKEMDTLVMSAVIDTMAKNVDAKFVKKDFRDFDYISVEPSNKAILITAIITFIIVLGLSLFSILNEYDEN